MKHLSIREKAINYRKKGYSYSMISGRLGLAKSTLSDWLKEIPYTPNQEVLKRIQFGPAKSGQIAHNRKIRNITIIKRTAKKELGRLTRRDLWLLGIGIYLGEGMKLQESIRIINSDPEIIKTAIKWFKEICGLKNKNITATIHTYPDNDVKNTTNYWSEITGICKEQFGKVQIDRRKNKSGKKKRKLPHGTLHLQIRCCGKKEFGKSLHRRIMGWIESSLEQINAGVV